MCPSSVAPGWFSLEAIAQRRGRRRVAHDANLHPRKHFKIKRWPRAPADRRRRPAAASTEQARRRAHALWNAQRGSRMRGGARMSKKFSARAFVVGIVSASA
eukprot:3243642-Pyramimonas_sp.AAC.1